MHIFIGQAHTSGLANGKNSTEDGWNGMDGKKVPTSDTYDRLNFPMENQ